MDPAETRCEVRAARKRVVLAGAAVQLLYVAAVILADHLVNDETRTRCAQINCDAGDRFGVGLLWLFAVLPLLYLVGAAVTIAVVTLSAVRLPRKGIVTAAAMAAALFGIPLVVVLSPVLRVSELLIPPVPITLAALLALNSAARPAPRTRANAIPARSDGGTGARLTPVLGNHTDS